MKYLAVLGRQPEFGFIELESVLGSAPEAFGSGIALLPTLPHIDRLGGSLKLAEILWRGTPPPGAELPIEVNTLAKPGKTTFGLSVYGAKIKPRDLLQRGLELKKRLAGTASARYVAPKEGQVLTAAQIKFNRLLELGFELIVAYHGDEMILATTVAVQDIDAYTARDHERPARSAVVGMLPPKLAQIMINTTPSGSAVYDPFVGTGVIPQEALLMGRPAAGSDLAQDMVEASQTNLKWLAESHPDLPVWDITHADATDVQLSEGTWSIVSEGFLGPNLSRTPSEAEIMAMQRDLRELYSDALTNFAAQLPPGGALTITQPTWQAQNESITPLSVDLITDLGYTINRFAAPGTHLPIYRRPDQMVGRQLLILRKN